MKSHFVMTINDVSSCNFVTLSAHYQAYRNGIGMNTLHDIVQRKGLPLHRLRDYRYGVGSTWWWDGCLEGIPLSNLISNKHGDDCVTNRFGLAGYAKDDSIHVRLLA